MIRVPDQGAGNTMTAADEKLDLHIAVVGPCAAGLRVNIGYGDLPGNRDDCRYSYSAPGNRDDCGYGCSVALIS